MEYVQQFRPNVVGFQLATGERRWYIVGCYLGPDNTSMLESVVVALKECPRGAELLVAGDLNIQLAEPEGDRRGEYITEAMAMVGLEGMSAHFLPRRSSWCQDGRVQSMIREGTEVWSRTD